MVSIFLTGTSLRQQKSRRFGPGNRGTARVQVSRRQSRRHFLLTARQAGTTVSYVRQLRTLCIIPPWQQRHHCANASAIMVFSHDAAEVQAPATRAFTLLALRPDPSGFTADELTMPVKDEASTLAASLSRAAEAARRDPNPVGFKGEEVDALVANWKLVLDYTVKVLLYLNLDDATLRQTQAFTDAPKEWPGLGRRKREARMAEVEQLYDRCIVGPASVADWAGEHAGQLGAHGQLSAHWRRGHFRLQAHGPQASLRKVMFIMPTVVRADRLAEA